MARATMSWLITEVRILIDDSDSNYFTDDQIQDVLDRTRLPMVDRELLLRDREDKVYQSRHKDFEGDADTWSGDTTIALWGSVGEGATEYDPDSWNLRNGTFTFTSSQDRNLWLDAYEYDPYLAASDLCIRLSAKESITPGGGETGGAIRGRAELRYLSSILRRDAKPRRGRLKKVRRRSWTRRY